jgi:hypothetical protein
MKSKKVASQQPFFLSEKRDSNPRPLAWEANALPTELLSLLSLQKYNFFIVFC